MQDRPKVAAKKPHSKTGDTTSHTRGQNMAIHIGLQRHYTKDNIVYMGTYLEEVQELLEGMSLF